MSDLFNLGGKAAAVTGANTGLGQAMAVALAGAGAKVALVCRTEPTETARLIAEQGGKSVAIMADLSSIGDCVRIVDETIAAFGALDILVNNAGVIRRADALAFTEDAWDAVIDTKPKTPFFLAKSAAAKMVESGQGGKIINVASLLSFQGGIRIASYTASKSGLAGLTRLLANEWAAKGINVNAIVPGYFATNNTVALRNDAVRNGEILSRIPAGRWGDPRDLAGAVVFLASRASDYVHGALLPVDGGWLAR